MRIPTNLFGLPKKHKLDVRIHALRDVVTRNTMHTTYAIK